MTDSRCKSIDVVDEYEDGNVIVEITRADGESFETFVTSPEALRELYDAMEPLETNADIHALRPLH